MSREMRPKSHRDFSRNGPRYFLPALCHGWNLPARNDIFSRALYEHSLQPQYINLPYLFLEADKEVHYCKEKENIMKSEKRELIALQSQ